MTEAEIEASWKVLDQLLAEEKAKGEIIAEQPPPPFPICALCGNRLDRNYIDDREGTVVCGHCGLVLESVMFKEEVNSHERAERPRQRLAYNRLSYLERLLTQLQGGGRIINEKAGAVNFLVMKMRQFFRNTYSPALNRGIFRAFLESLDSRLTPLQIYYPFFLQRAFGVKPLMISNEETQKIKRRFQTLSFAFDVVRHTKDCDGKKKCHKRCGCRYKMPVRLAVRSCFFMSGERALRYLPYLNDFLPPGNSEVRVQEGFNILQKCILYAWGKVPLESFRRFVTMSGYVPEACQSSCLGHPRVIQPADERDNEEPSHQNQHLSLSDEESREHEVEVYQRAEVGHNLITVDIPKRVVQV